MALRFIVSSLVRTICNRLCEQKGCWSRVHLLAKITLIDQILSEMSKINSDRGGEQRKKTGGWKERRKKCPPFLSWEGQIAADGVKNGHYLWVSRAKLSKFVGVNMFVSEHLSPARSSLAFLCPLTSLSVQLATESHRWSDMLTGVWRVLRSTHKHISQGNAVVRVCWAWLTVRCTEGIMVIFHNVPVKSTYFDVKFMTMLVH